MEGEKIAPGHATTNLGKYRLIAELGHGGMAEVYLAVVRGPAGFNKLVVIKQIRPQLAEDPEFLNMFLDEARLAARLSHPNVVQTNEVGQDGDRYFIAMEYLEGQPLNRIIHRLARTQQALSLEMHVRILAEVLAGLHHAHELADYDGTPLGVVHRDVTPHNVFVTYDGQIKVVDFGIAKALNSSAETRTGVLKGKVAYMAPEQARGERVDRRADIFSVGVLLWEAATGKRLWKGVPDITILQRLLASEIPPPSAIKADIPYGLEPIVLRAMAHDREDRYATAADLQADLEAFLETIPQRTTTREIGRLVMKTFDADRTKIRVLIEEQLKVRPIDVGLRQSLPFIEPTVSGSSLPHVQERSSQEPRSSPPNRAGHTPVGHTPVGHTPVGHTPGHTPVGLPQQTSSSSSSLTGAGSFSAPPIAGAGSSRRGIVAVGALLGGAALAVGFYVATRSPAPPVTDAAAVTASAFAPIAAAQPAATAEPALQARVTSTPAPPPPEVVTEAKPAQTAQPAQPAHHVSAPPPPPPDDDMKRPTTRPKRTLDPTNPYQK